MLDVSQHSTSLLVSPDGQTSQQEPLTFNTLLEGAFKEHQQALKTIEAQRLEIERLTEELRQLRAGKSVEVIIDGNRFTLGSGLVTPLPVVATNGHKSGVEDSFVL